MIKKKKKFKADLIITADWHLREDTPICRTDDFWEAQWYKVNQIFNLSNRLDVPIYNAGDLFNHWKSSPRLINKCIERFVNRFKDNRMKTIIGNHEMPQHNLSNMEKSAWDTLYRVGIIDYMFAQGSWGRCDSEKERKKIIPKKIKNRKFVMLHVMTYKGKKPWPNCTDPECHELFDWFDADLIITGHNHKTFTAKKGKQLLVNPGSLTRQTADQIDHKPCIFLYNAEQHKLKKHTLEYKKNVISREHIDVKKQKDKRITAFIEKLKDGYNLSLSFEDNLEIAFKENKTPKKIQQIILEWMGV